MCIVLESTFIFAYDIYESSIHIFFFGRIVLILLLKTFLLCPCECALYVRLHLSCSNALQRKKHPRGSFET